MKRKFPYFVCLLIGVLVFSSCAAMREKKAEHHQPFSPHKNKKQKHGHPATQQHHQ
jgi:hypothetical protein